jgi:hypothetical protein
LITWVNSQNSHILFYHFQADFIKEARDWARWPHKQPSMVYRKVPSPYLRGTGLIQKNPF